MRSIKAGGWLLRVWAVLSLCCLGAGAYAFAPASSPLLSAAAVTPNVILLVDDSGSMNSIIRATGFDQTASELALYACGSNSSCDAVCNFNGKQCGNYPTQLDTDDENLFLSSVPQGSCGSGYDGFSRGNGTTQYCLKLPDPVGGGNTRWSVRYLSWLITNLPSGTTTKDFTDGSIPNDYRINVARNSAIAIINANRTLRFGLATFYSPNYSTGDYGPGGYIANVVADISTSTTASQSNYTGLVKAINNLSAVANTPLAETYYEITRYFRGMTSYSNTASMATASGSRSSAGTVSTVTYTSPIQYRCQKNYGVVITDGLPTYDRTFPTDDPLGTSNLPNWDGVNNDGDNLQGDGEGDTLYLDDIAKFAYDIDMRTTSNGTDGAGKSWDDPAFLQQNLSTYTVGFTSTNQMLSDAAAYGHGTYYQATDSATLATALNAALSNINSKSGSGGGGSSSSSTLSTGTYYYQTLYDPTDWRGIINAYPFNTDGTVNTTAATWTSNNTILPASTKPTFDSSNGTSIIAMAYGNYTAAQQALLNASLPTGVTGAQLISWSQGTNVTGLRARTVLLGDIINSPLTYASPTDQTASDLVGDSTYTTYLTTKAANMTPQLVVNANDGFANVINANTGRRVYAYMPSSALANLNQVAATTYVNGTSHTFLNDGQVAVFDTQIGSAWKTMAFGGTGAGGKAFYGMQLFDAAAGNVVKTLWEIRAPDTANAANVYNDLGYAYAKPDVARLPDGRWAAFIANGYGSNSGVAALYVVNVADGSLITKLVVDTTETTNGLSSVKLSVNASNVVQAAYAGDLKGRMWKFDLSSTSTTAWGLAFSGKPLFTAPLGTAQPITAQPLLVATTTTAGSGTMVYFGTGKFNEVADKTTTAVQGFYAVFDMLGASGNYTTANLVAQAITGSFTGTAGQYMTTTANAVDYTSKKGWYLPLTYNSTLVGERVIYQAAYTLGRILFTTAGVDTTDPCSSQGFGRLVELDALAGGMLNYSVLDTNGDGVVNSTDVQSSGIIFSSGIPNLTAVINIAASGTTASSQTKIVNDSSGKITALKEKGGGGSRRIMWRQIQ